MQARRGEGEEVITDVRLATESGCVAAEHFDVLAKVASGRMQEHI
jgi:hypothetical protein